MTVLRVLCLHFEGREELETLRTLLLEMSGSVETVYKDSLATDSVQVLEAVEDL